MSAGQLLAVIPLGEKLLDTLRQRFALCYAPQGPKSPALADAATLPIGAVITNGSTGFNREQMDRLPQLKLICCFGAGYENVDLGAARARGIAVAHAPGANDATVADHALALMLALARGLVVLDRAVRAGQWRSSRSERPTLSGGRLGIIGLGRIGTGIAKRAAAFGMTIGYYQRRPRNDVPWTYYPALLELAGASDFLVAACPGGPATRHIVNREVLAALGPGGCFINIARGSVVDTQALTAALTDKTLGSAGLDVIEGEPEVPAELLSLDNVLITPHLAGRSPAAVQAQCDALLANLGAHLAGTPLPFPVPVS